MIDENSSPQLTLVSICLALVAACDPRAKASDQTRTELKSKEYESCAATLNCQDELRCLEHACRRTARSTVGDYFAALGTALRAKGDVDGAIDAYTRAHGHYESEKLAVPPDIDCAYGAVLAAGKAKKDNAEHAARLLHGCVLAVPVSSALRDHALADLATLSDAGLDPLTLGRTALADAYLTRSPAAPTTDKLTVTITASPQPAGKTYQNIPDKLGEPDQRAALVACWQTYNTAAHKDAMAVTIGLKATYTPSEYEDEQGVFGMKLEPPTALVAGSPEAAADQCVRAVVEPALKALTTVRDAFATKLTISVK